MEDVHVIRNSWNQKNKTEKIVNLLLKIAIIILGIIAIAEIVFQFVIAPRLKIQDIIIESDLALPDEEILAIAGVKRSDSYYSLNPDEIREHMLKNPLIREAGVEKLFPNTVKLSLRKRTPVAITLIEERGISIPAYIDREGVVFHIGKVNEADDFPVLSGLDFRGYEIGMRLPETFKNFLGELSVLKDTSRTLYNFISEIKLVPGGTSGEAGVSGDAGGSGDFELLFYMIPYITRIRFGSGVNESSLSYALLALDVLEQKGLSKTVKEIDFRSKAIVYRKYPIEYR